MNLEQIIRKNRPSRNARIGIYVIDLNTGRRFGFNENEFIYPASTYKIFIGAEVLRQASTFAKAPADKEQGAFSLSKKIKIKSPNDIDNESRFYPTDTHQVLRAGDIVTVDTLMKLMLGRSDNTASNVLIDLVGRESISKNIVRANKWDGSDVTRKFLNRAHEDADYKFADITVACARHFAEFMEKLARDKLISASVSRKLKEYMRGGAVKIRAKNFLKNAEYEKGGWLQVFSRNPFRFIRNRGIIRYQSIAAIVRHDDLHYAIGIVSQYRTIFPWNYFRFSELQKEIEKAMTTPSSAFALLRRDAIPSLKRRGI